MRTALLLATVLALAGCLGATPEQAPDEDTDPPRHDGPNGPDNPDDPAGPGPQDPVPDDLPSNADFPATWALTALDCDHGYYTFLADRAAIIARLPEGVSSYGNNTVAFAYLFVHQCGAMVHGNDSLARDVTLTTLYVDILHDGDRHMFLLEALTDWPYLAERLADLGAVVRLVDVEHGDLGALTFTGDGLRYRMEPTMAADGDPSSPRTHDLRTGRAGEHLLHYEVIVDVASLPTLASVVQVEGGVLGEILFSSVTAVTRHDTYGSFRIIQQYEPMENQT